MARVFLLSPARCSGERARMLVGGKSLLAERLRSPGGVPIGELFSWLSALYFRGKLTYAQRFGDALVITPCYGLLPASAAVGVKELAAMGEVDIASGDARYLRPLERHARAVAKVVDAAVLLGSIGTGKYIEPLQAIFAERLLFPAEFVGRGDMSRGGLLLRSARAGTELRYLAVAGATRHGPRPPKLPRLRTPKGLELVILIGLPGSGKSTFYSKHLTGYEQISRDLMKRPTAAKQAQLIAAALAAGRSVVVDNTNATRPIRAPLIAQARAAGVRVIGYFLDVREAECLQRNRLREGRARVPDAAIWTLAARLDPPRPDEGFDELYAVTT